jgi:GNAT superfamily N-acetyltransferase
MNPMLPISIQMLHPERAKPPAEPLTLKQIRQITAHGASDAHLDETVSNAGNWLDGLKGLSKRHRTPYFFCPQTIKIRQFRALLAALNERPTRLRLGLTVAVDEAVSENTEIEKPSDALVQIQWRPTGPLPSLKFFKIFSQAGVWNHLIIDGRSDDPEKRETAALAPNIIHSREATDTGKSPPIFDSPYDQVRKLPGRPLWQVVTDPAKRLLLADRLTKNRLVRLRVDDEDRLFYVGKNLRYCFVSSDRLPQGYLDEICAMVAAGGTVAATHVRANLKHAFLIGYVEDNGILVANSSLKNPRSEYIENVRRQSGLNLTGYVERGYTSVRPEYRGLGMGTKLLEGLTRRAGDRKIFSVISEDNLATQTIAQRNRTRKVATYYSQKAGKPVGIWMPEWMITNDDHR